MSAANDRAVARFYAEFSRSHPDLRHFAYGELDELVEAYADFIHCQLATGKPRQELIGIVRFQELIAREDVRVDGVVDDVVQLERDRDELRRRGVDI